jgi:peptidoglycan/LPS O-acetylase OafA/YrhL
MSANLDLLRSIAVLLVVASHLPPTRALLAGLPYHVGSLGLLGVACFCVLTCVVLMQSMQRQIETLGAEGRAAAFFVRRFLRIYPLSIVVVLITHALPSAFARPALEPRVTLSNLALVQNLTGDESFPGPLWFLPYQVQVCLLLPLLYALVVRAGSYAAAWLVVAWALAIGLVLVLFALGTNYHVVKYLPCFLPGVLAYALRDRPQTLPPWVLVLFVGAIAILLPTLVAQGARENVLAWPVCLALGFLIPHCREITGPWLRRGSSVLSKYSYGVYLLHVPCLELVVLGELPGVVRWPLWLVALAALSWLGYHTVERPAIQLGNRLAASVVRRASVRARVEG